MGPAHGYQEVPGQTSNSPSLTPPDERHPFVLVEVEGRTAGVLGVANLDGAVGKDLDGNTAALVRHRRQPVALGRERVRVLGGRLLIH